MKRRKKAIKRAERRGAREWSLKVAPTYLAIIADKDERIRELDAEGERLGAGCIACPSLAEAQMRANGLERELAAAVRAREDAEDERDRMKMERDYARNDVRNLRSELVAVAEDRDRLQQAHDQAQQEVRELAVHLHAADAERDRLRHGERERLMVATGILRASNEKLQAEVVQLTAERNYHIDSLNTERGEWQRTITQEQASTRAGWDRANELREQRESLRESVGELQAENGRLHDQLTNYSVVSEHTEQSLRDAKLGRLVRAMPGGLELYRTERGTPWRTAYLGDREPRFGETPEAALESAGVTIPPVANADSGLWRYAEEAAADTRRLDWLERQQWFLSALDCNSDWKPTNTTRQAIDAASSVVAEERRTATLTGADVVAGSGEDGY